jgi:RNA polymerase sigma-70 factor (ECF subfamily)
MERDLSDAEAIRRSVADPALFRVVFDRHFPVIHGYLRHRAGADVADDLAAETFVRAFGARARFRPQKLDARAWLFAIATNLLRDHARGHVRRGSLLTRLVGQPQPEPVTIAEAPDPGLAAALGSLREEEREALLLYAWAELSYEEIAAATGTRLGTVRSRLSRARERLRLILDEEASAPDAIAVMQPEGAGDD